MALDLMLEALGDAKGLAWVPDWPGDARMGWITFPSGREVWSYQSDIETHTVETHIYRLRKKILNTFNDNEFIVSKKNGYQIK